ncbi:MAG: GAF domain-containing protein [Armatimonadota bacterium]|nr:GAF domain-containing protein [Armatimonadota bacterium]MDR7448970.1 GAF domain-containing protein [Armatimonadota bacterium]MDR7460386.1 GAF domain-containing protein [Armatimonadota bacterium]MDR7480527.1 GAF domain-containing protein [Armatimonadota bacterium]MDR7489150.1 GAF domain-containing protein [Armatimonadota bacterium]
MRPTAARDPAAPPTPLRVLIVEDNQDDALLLVRQLQQAGYVPSWRRVETAGALADALQEAAWDLVLCDFTMPQFTAVDALRLLQEREVDLPFLIVSGTVGEDVAVEAMKAGAHDYIMKGHLARLAPAVARELRDAEVRRERRRVEEELRKLSRAVEQGPGIVVITDPLERIEYVNPRFTAVTGFTPEDVLGMPVHRLADPVVPEQQEARLATLRGGGTWQGELHAYRKDGTRYWELATVSPIRDGRGRITHYVKVAEDITERKRVEAALREADQRAIREYRQLLERLADLEQRVGTAHELRQVFRAVRDFVASSVPFDRLAVYLDDPTGAHRTCVYAAAAEGEEQPGQPPAVVDSASRAREALLEPELAGPGGVPDAGHLVDETIEGQGAPQAEAPAMLVVPLAVMGRTIGALEVQGTGPAPYLPEHVVAVQVAASVAAIAIENVQLLDRERRLREQAERRVQRLGALRAIEMAIGSSLDVRVTLNVILDQVTLQLGVDAACVLLLARTQTLRFAAARGFRTTALQRTHLRLGEGYAGQAALERRRIEVSDLRMHPGAFTRSRLFPQEEFVAYMAVPLVAKGQVKGVLELFHRSPLAPEEEWLDFLDAVAMQAAIAIDHVALFDDLQRSNVNLTLAYDTTLEGWSRALDLRDRETQGHTQRVAELCVRLGQAAGLGEEDLIHLRRGALLHDIGKMGVPDAILHKPGPLTDAEWAVMRQHPVYAYELLAPIDFLRPALDVSYCHHERWDGSGYPRGLRGEAIPLAARIFAVVDVWDALTSERPYRPAWSREEALAYIREQAGRLFDPRIARIFVDLVERGDA